MPLLSWAQQLTDDYLISWTNRGLLRRAKRFSEQADTTQWQITNEQITGSIVEKQLCLSQANLNGLSCSCGDLEPCSHKLAFLIALRNASAFPVATQVTTQEVTQEVKPAETTPQTTAAPDPVTSFIINNWLITDPQSLTNTLKTSAAAFSASTVKRAIKDWHQGAQVELKTHTKHGQVTCTLRNSKVFTIHLPAIASWQQAICSCKATCCVHQALAIIGLSVKAGKLSLATEQLAEKLQPNQTEQIAALQFWLNQLIAHGLKNLLPSQLAQGQALITELNQADLPNLAARLSNMLGTLANIMRHCIDINTAHVLTELTYLSLYLRSLQQPVLPQAGYKLTGEHKRRYLPIQCQSLMAVMVEHWQALNGAIGYRYYLYDLQQGDWYCFADGRRPNMDRQWASTYAFDNQKCDQHYLSDLQFKSFDLVSKVSRDRTLLCNSSQLLNAPEPVHWQQLWSNPQLSVNTQWQRLSQRTLQPDFSTTMGTLGWIKTTEQYHLKWQAYRAYGETTVTSDCGQQIVIRQFVKGEVARKEANKQQSSNGLSANSLASANQQQKLLFGRWFYDANERHFEVLQVLTEQDFSDR